MCGSPVPQAHAPKPRTRPAAIPSILSGARPCLLCGVPVQWRRVDLDGDGGLHLVDVSGRVHNCNDKGPLRKRGGRGLPANKRQPVFVGGKVGEKTVRRESPFVRRARLRFCSSECQMRYYSGADLATEADELAGA